MIKKLLSIALTCILASCFAPLCPMANPLAAQLVKLQGKLGGLKGKLGTLKEKLGKLKKKLNPPIHPEITKINLVLHDLVDTRDLNTFMANIAPYINNPKINMCISNLAEHEHASIFRAIYSANLMTEKIRQFITLYLKIYNDLIYADISKKNFKEAQQKSINHYHLEQFCTTLLGNHPSDEKTISDMEKITATTSPRNLATRFSSFAQLLFRVRNHPLLADPLDLLERSASQDPSIIVQNSSLLTEKEQVDFLAQIEPGYKEIILKLYLTQILTDKNPGKKKLSQKILKNIEDKPLFSSKTAPGKINILKKFFKHTELDLLFESKTTNSCDKVKLYIDLYNKDALLFSAKETALIKKNINGFELRKSDLENKLTQLNSRLSQIDKDMPTASAVTKSKLAFERPTVVAELANLNAEKTKLQSEENVFIQTMISFKPLNDAYEALKPDELITDLKNLFIDKLTRHSLEQGEVAFLLTQLDLGTLVPSITISSKNFIQPILAEKLNTDFKRIFTLMTTLDKPLREKLFHNIPHFDPHVNLNAKKDFCTSLKQYLTWNNYEEPFADKVIDVLNHVYRSKAKQVVNELMRPLTTVVNQAARDKALEQLAYVKYFIDRLNIQELSEAFDKHPEIGSQTSIAGGFSNLLQNKANVSLANIIDTKNTLLNQTPPNITMQNIHTAELNPGATPGGNSGANLGANPSPGAQGLASPQYILWRGLHPTITFHNKIKTFLADPDPADWKNREVKDVLKEIKVVTRNNAAFLKIYFNDELKLTKPQKEILRSILNKVTTANVTKDELLNALK